jgi:hypothetical protein
VADGLGLVEGGLSLADEGCHSQRGALSVIALRRISTRMAKQQISVKLDPDQLEFLERMAARQDRGVSGLVRHFVAEAVRQAAQQPKQRASA